MHKPSLRRRSRRSRIVAGCALVAVVALGVVLVLVLPSGHSNPSTASTRAAVNGTTAAGHGTTPTAAAGSHPAIPATTVGSPTTVTSPAAPTTIAPAAPPVPLMSSCHAVVHIGDSTSESLVSANYLPNPAQRLSAQYAQVGAVGQNFQISGARSIVETYEGEPNAYTVAQQIAASGYKGCWVVAMGINDAADIAAGSNVTATERIQRMMSAIGNQPVLWFGVRTFVSSGPYAEANMQSWDAALLQACTVYPNMRVLDWASQALPSYYIPDGIHYNSPGSAVLAAAFARGLATAFPQSGTSPPGCLVP